MQRRLSSQTELGQPQPVALDKLPAIEFDTFAGAKEGCDGSDLIVAQALPDLADDHSVIRARAANSDCSDFPIQLRLRVQSDVLSAWLLPEFGVRWDAVRFHCSSSPTCGRLMALRIIKRSSKPAPTPETIAGAPRTPAAPSGQQKTVLDRMVISLALKAAREDHDKELKLREK